MKKIPFFHDDLMTIFEVIQYFGGSGKAEGFLSNKVRILHGY